MSDEGHMDDAESGLQTEGDGDTGADDVVSNSDLANRRRRQQVRQACQQCRRRKIKVHIPSPYLTPPSLPPAVNQFQSFSNLPYQCDEVRPVCRPCQKARLACAYELPPGQTRAQAMMESQQRLRDELHSHTSLIHSLRCADANSSVHMLGRLRHGDYDSALLGTDHAIRSASPGDRIYPWEESNDEGHHHQRARDGGLLPPIDGFTPIRHDAGNVYSHSHSHDKPEHAYDNRAAMAPQVSSSSFANTTPINPGGASTMHNSDPRMAYQRAEMQYQSRGYQHNDMPLHPSLPSKDPTRNFPGPR